MQSVSDCAWAAPAARAWREAVGVQGLQQLNYYEHHIGDYAAATAHLSWDEDMAYTRLLRAYYHHERGIPQGQQYRVARATTAAQRKAVDAVLAEFFTLTGDTHLQKRADKEIARYQDKQRKAQASANARWSMKAQHSECNANAPPESMRTHSERTADAMRTHCEGNAPRHQSPDTSISERTNAEDARAHVGTKAGAVCIAMRRAGMASVKPGDPRLLALLEQGATEAEFVGLAAEAATKAKGWGWVLAVLQARRSEAAAIQLAPKAEQPKNDSAEKTQEYLASMQQTPEQRAASEEARRRVMAAVRRA